MTRQYIGARYVPKFYEGSSGTDWTANTTYEPLTIVTRNGNSYTSKRAVPASVGAPESNAYYWASTGIYNQQVEELREDIIAANERIDDTNERIDDLGTCALYIGNSFTRGNVESGVGHGLYYYSKDYFDESYMYYGDGIGFVPYTGHTSTFVTLLQQAAASTDFDNGKITDIVVISAWGDTRALAEGGAVNDGISSFCSYANANFPNLRHIYCDLAESRPLASDYSVGGIYNSLSNLYTLHATFKSYQAPKYVYVGWSGYRTMLNTNLFNSDNVHMTNSGYSVNANEMMAGFEGNMNYYNRTLERFSVTLDLTPVFGGGNIHGFVTSTPDSCEINFDRFLWDNVPDTFTPPTRTETFCPVPNGNQLHFSSNSRVLIPIKVSATNPAAVTGCAYIQFVRSAANTYGFSVYPYCNHFSGNKSTDGFSGISTCNAIYK